MVDGDAVVRPHDVTVGDVSLSGLLAEPKGSPRATVIALHGHGVRAAYWDHPVHPDLSLLRLGRELGYTVWAPDRPGYGATAGLPEDRFPMYPQADFLLQAIDAFTAGRDLGAGVFVVGHSYGLKLALCMAADPRAATWLGLDGSASGYRYAFDIGNERPPAVPGDKSPVFGPAHLYPERIFERGVAPVAPLAKPPLDEAEIWPAEFASFAARITIPVRFTFGAYDRLWPSGPEIFDELRAMLTNAPSIGFDILQDAGHNVSLAHAARAYHLKALAFADECVVARRIAERHGTA
ncbi:MAG: alpha/beta fold hydrolase [Acidimicrobiia bacterium]